MLPTSRTSNVHNINSVFNNLKQSQEKAGRRQNIALLARLELIADQNKQLKMNVKMKREKALQDKLSALRQKEFQRMNPPPKRSLPLNQRPGPEYKAYNLNGETDLNYFFRDMRIDKIEEQIIKENKEEPRIVTRMLRDMDSDLKQHAERKMAENSEQPQRDNLLNGLNVPQLDENDKPESNLKRL